MNHDIFKFFRQKPVLDNTVWLLGCSFIWGLGVNLTDSVPYMLQRFTGKTVDNLGICGGSPILVHDTLKYLLNNHTPEMVIISWPGINRTYYIRDGKAIINMGPWVEHPDRDRYKYQPSEINEYKQGIIDGSIIKKNLEGMSQAKQLITCPYLPFRINHDVKEIINNNHQYLDKASDNRHPGPRTNKYIAITMANWVNQQSSFKTM